MWYRSHIKIMETVRGVVGCGDNASVEEEQKVIYTENSPDKQTDKAVKKEIS